MVLSGALKDFILADVFNLLALQKVTGRLSLSDDRREGGILFKDGIIIGADCGEENLQNKLFNYMIDVKRKTTDHIGQLFNTNAGNLTALAAGLIEHGMMSQRELKSFAEVCVEDICCSLLTWNRGTYRFNAVRSVTAHACGFVTIPTENIIMEGMRRADEWGRMQEYIQEEMIFVPAVKGGDIPKEFDVISAPEEYVMSLLDGSNTVGCIKKSCCLCEYKVFESINTLLQSQRITALHPKYTQSIQAALKRKDAEEASILGKSFFGSLLSGLVAAAFLAFCLFFRLALLPGMAGGNNAAAAKTETPADAVLAAKQLHYAVIGDKAGNADAETLKNAGFLSDRDR